MNDQWQREIQKAVQARRSGNEGLARVCSRRAAGAAAREFLSQAGINTRSMSAFSALKALEEYPTLSPELKNRARQLTLRVNEEFKLPGNVDLIAEAINLIEGLEKHESN